MTATLLSIQVGEPRTYTQPPRFARRSAPWRSGFVKEPVHGPVQLGPTNLAGDGQADLRAHGGAHKAVNVYPSEHYPHWLESGVLAAGHPGQFGENFTVQGLLETEVCIGDRFRVGDAVVEVSQPRQPCWKLAHFVGCADLVKRVIEAGRTGWYFRVLEPGQVQPGESFQLLERPYGRWTLAEANQVMHHRRDDHAASRALAACPALSESWCESLGRRG